MVSMTVVAAVSVTVLLSMVTVATVTLTVPVSNAVSTSAAYDSATSAVTALSS
jgi:hypothetical protein